MRILVAGIGNIFFGDDAFGVEVVRELARYEFPEGVRVEDFGIRSYDLAYAIVDGYDAVILVDATPRKQPPGTVSLIELDSQNLPPGSEEAVDAQSLNPACVLQMVEAMGGQIRRLYLVGCEPAVLETEELGLSPQVMTAVPNATELIQAFIQALLEGAAEKFIAPPAGVERH
jgi:hydrogenase maturation protease